MRRIHFSIVLLLAFLSRGVFAESHATVTGALSVSALQQGKAAKLAVVLEVADGFHAQSHAPLDESLIKCQLKLDPVPGIEFGDASYPDGKIEEYPELGKLSVYTGKTVIVVPIKVSADANLGAIKITGKLGMQICDSKNCFPPEKDPFSVEAQVVSTTTSVEPANQALFPANTPTPTPTSKPATTRPASLDRHFSLLGFSGDIDSTLGAMIAALIAGLIFNVMPCVLPVLPLKAIGFYEVSQHDRKRTILLGSVFSLGVISFFAGLAVVVLLSKQLFGRQFSWGPQFSSPIFVWSIAVILIGLGIGMLGMFALRPAPAFHSQRFTFPDAISHKPSRACITPPRC